MARLAARIAEHQIRGSPQCGIAALLMTGWGQKLRFDALPATSGLPRSTDIIRPARLVRFVPIPDLAAVITCRVRALRQMHSGPSSHLICSSRTRRQRRRGVPGIVRTAAFARYGLAAAK